jgi:hypothetical protein
MGKAWEKQEGLSEEKSIWKGLPGVMIEDSSNELQ